MNNLYNDAVQMGQVHSWFSILYQLITVIFIICLIFFGYKYYKKNFRDNFVDTTATIIGSKCNFYTPDKSPGQYSCNLHISYIVDGKKYDGNIISNSYIQYKPGSTVTVCYNRMDPNIVKMKEEHGMYYFFVALILVMTIAPVIKAFYNYYMTHRFGTYSGIFGTGAAFNSGMRSM